MTRSPAAHLTAICIAVRWGAPGDLSSRRCANWTFPYGVMPVCKTVGDLCRPLTFVAGPEMARARRLQLPARDNAIPYPARSSLQKPFQQHVLGDHD